MNLKSRLSQIVFAFGALHWNVACSGQPTNSNDFSCDNERQMAVWRARIFENFSAGARLADAHAARYSSATLGKMRDLNLQLRDYFQSEPMPECMRGAIRIYIDGTQALQDKDKNSDLLVAMKHMSDTIDRFSEAVAAAKP